MKGKVTRFFATLNDIEPIIKCVESVFDIQCYDTKRYLSDDKVFTRYDSILQIPNLGYTEIGNNFGINYLLIPKTASLNIEEIPQIKGGLKFTADSNSNKDSINFRFAGIYTAKQNVLVESSISYLFVEKFSKDLYDFFSKKIKKEFKLIDGFYAGKEAEEKLRQGWRLVQDERRDIGYDLKL
ncbi:hypothetical protein [Flavobacterium sp. CLA17]|uniref:hypothetical protein n=1 Tax=Flavobacterium sp. CLA17 TaxID=2724135 RepID=UPI0014928CFF|nr:hypothetical protein [Flavobacterium sp. CLA17]QSB26508.1 hypothetical protein HAV12_019405 [Flavobacterium sp. CLA17]